MVNGKEPEIELPTYTATKGEEAVPQPALILLTEANAETGHTWHNLPVYSNDGTKIIYTVKETGMWYQPESGDQIEISGWDDAFTTGLATESEDEPGVFTIDNTLKTTEIQVTKVWTKNHVAREDKTEITYKLYQSGEEEEELDLSSNTSGYTLTADHGTATANKVLYIGGSGWQTITISGLPKYKVTVDTTKTPATAVYERVNYYVTEVAGEDMTYTTVTYKKTEGETTGDEVNRSADAATNDGRITIYNRDTDLTLKVLKVDTTDNEIKLKDAVFQLQKQKEDGTYAVYTSDLFSDSQYATEEDVTLTIVDEEVGISFRMLTDGNYKLIETKAPDGYIRAQTPELEFTVTDGVITPDIAADGFVIDYLPVSQENDTPTVTIGNTPGVELPSTGGNGTLIYTVAGMALIVLAGVLLVSRRRRKE